MPILLENSSEHLHELVEFWNACAVEPFWMDALLMGQYLKVPGARVWVDGSPWKGALWARFGSRATTLDALWVRPEMRRRGVGGSLLDRFRAEVEPDRAWRFGGGEHHFVPGVPESLSEFHPFFAKHGLVADWHAHDLLWTHQSAATTDWDDSVYRLIEPGQIDELARLLEYFGARWQIDTAARCQDPLEGRAEEIMGAFQEERLVGFCHIWSPRSRRLGPSTFWLPRDRTQMWGGIGPLGVHPEMRGHGYGAGVVEASMAYLRSRGAEVIGVDWTGLPDFYEGRGFRRWLDYRGYHPEVDRGSGGPGQ